MLEHRRKNLKKRFEKAGIDAFITLDTPDIFYFTHFHSEASILLVSTAGDYFFTPGLLSEHAKDALKNEKGLPVISEKSLLASLKDRIKKHSLKKIGIDPGKLTVTLHQQLSRIPDVKWVPLPDFILEQRMIKEENEVSAISKACHITWKAVQNLFKNLPEGKSESETSYWLEDQFHKMGSPRPAFDTIVAFGKHGAYPHHVVGPTKLAKNQSVLVDLGCKIGGYCADLTRTTFYGKISPKFKEIYGIVKESQEAGIAALKEGITAGEADQVCRKIIEKAGYGDYFIHSTGHGVGIEIHEPPRLGTYSNEILKNGMVVTIEPGIYLPGQFGVRIEDTLLITPKGAKTLTR